MIYEPIIGLEIHSELATATKLFCGCCTKFGAPANSQVCPVCMGHPGVLPVVNERAVEYMIKISLALNCKITNLTKFDRKNYYYPDLPKNYQISQQYLPFAKDGFLEIKTAEGNKKIGIGNIHLEEDAGKNIHPEGKPFSLVDLNRTGIPLVEIVTKPNLRDIKEVEVFMNNLRDILLYTEVSDCKMQEGSLRFEANISVREKPACLLPQEAGRGQTHLPPRVEIKNLNSFKIVLSAIKHEIERQTAILNKKGKVLQETRLWDDEKLITRPMRSKEEAHDYRYFPEPDLPPLFISEEEIEKTNKDMPELPNARKERFMAEYGLNEYDSNIILSDKEMADFFEKSLKVKGFNPPKEVANWLTGPVTRYLNEHNISIKETKFTPELLVGITTYVHEGTINQNTAKNILPEILEKGKSPEELIKEKGLTQVTDEEEISKAVDKVLQANRQAVEDFKNGKIETFGFLVGQVMKITKGKANPKIAGELIKKRLKSL